MNVLAPISSAEEVEMLAENGAEEFYCGVLPTEWIKKFSAGVWMNRRNPQASLPSYEEFALLVERSQKYSIPVFIALNAPYYTQDQIPSILEMVKETQSLGAGAFIVSDIGLMKAIKDHVPNAQIHVSSLATPINKHSVHMFKELGANRIVFPRSLHLDEIAEIIDAGGKEIEYEVFILNDGCIYEEGNCFTTHNQVGAFCSTENWDFEWQPSNGDKTFSSLETVKLEQHIKDYREFVWYTNSCGCTLSDQGLPLGPCGLCALPSLAKIGVNSLKIVGRETSPYRKLASVQLVSEIVRSVREGVEEKSVKEKAIRIRKTPDKCASGYMCYYK
ncbi:U32 family peptidase [Bacillus sp. FJAT-45350]|uniref:U32 family peptidase n=1 Tax=Bacillus sp. FJAT-45350 TaxID=2011014 RepID=UPI000BB7820B|nr:U32 family peptidase [Bacillus sp. FJAT-45350]